MSRDEPPTQRLLTPGSNCWHVATADRVSAIVDAADYFAAFAEALATRAWLEHSAAGRGRAGALAQVD